MRYALCHPDALIQQPRWVKCMYTSTSWCRHDAFMYLCIMPIRDIIYQSTKCGLLSAPTPYWIESLTRPMYVSRKRVVALSIRVTTLYPEADQPRPMARKPFYLYTYYIIWYPLSYYGPTLPTWAQLQTLLCWEMGILDFHMVYWGRSFSMDLRAILYIYLSINM